MPLDAVQGERLASLLAAIQVTTERLGQMRAEAHELQLRALPQLIDGEVVPTAMGRLMRKPGTKPRAKVNQFELEQQYEALPAEVRALVTSEEQVKVVQKWPTVAELRELLKDPSPFIIEEPPPVFVVLIGEDGVETKVGS